MPIAGFVDVIVVRAVERDRRRMRFPGFHRTSRRRADVRRPRLWRWGGLSCLVVHDPCSLKNKRAITLIG